MAKSSPLNSEFRLTHVQKLLFKGPDPPIQTEEEEEDEGRKEYEQTFYDDFAQSFKDTVTSNSEDL